MLNLRPSSAPFLSGDTYRRFATKEYHGGTIEIDQPAIIFTSTDLLDEFILNSEKINYPFVLISHHSDKTVNEDYRTFASSDNLIHWYAQNNILNHPKITAIPIGLEDRWRHNNGIIQEFAKLRKSLNLPQFKKNPRILVGFSIETNPAVRKPALEVLQSLKTADHFRGDSRQYRKKLAEYMFVASPEGNGIDCHRTWEALYLGVVPIVTTRDFHGQFPDMPVLAIDKWSDLEFFDQGDLEKIYFNEIKKLSCCIYIWAEYWKEKLRARLNAFKQ